MKLKIFRTQLEHAGVSGMRPRLLFAVVLASEATVRRVSELAVGVMASSGCRVPLLAASVFVAGAIFFVIGALGPEHTWAHHHPVSTCVVKDSFRHVRDPGTTLVDDTECGLIGKPMDLEVEDNKKYYPLENVLFHVQIPFLNDQVMSRKFHFVVTDLAIHFNNDYLKLTQKQKMNLLFMEVVLGYRDNLRGPWQRMVQGNITRTIRCHPNEWKYMECDHMQLFELGSVSHKQYLVNLAFSRLPLSTVPQYSGIAPLNKLSLYVIHQTIAFTELWFTLKCVLFPVSLVMLCWLLWRLAGNPTPASLTHKCLVFMCVALTGYNAPVEMLSLYLDLPWMLVVDDFRHGLLTSSLFLFWIILVGEHTPGGEGGVAGGRSLGSYWKQLVTIGVGAVFMFVYEFCERGIQTVYPFYSLWGNWIGVTVAYVFVGVAVLSGVVYLVMFLVMVVKAYRHLSSQQSSISHLSPPAQQKARAGFAQWRWFLLLTAAVAVTSISSLVLPSDALVHQWQHERENYSMYTALLIGNYGLWNAYALVTALMHAPSSSGGESTTETAEKLLKKQAGD